MEININLADENIYLSNNVRTLISKTFTNKIFSEYLKLEVDSYIDLDCNCGESHIDIYGKLSERFCNYLKRNIIENVTISFSIDFELKKDCNNLICMFEIAKHFHEVISISVNQNKHTKRHGKKYKIIKKNSSYEIESLYDEKIDDKSIEQSNPLINLNRKIKY